MAEIELYFEGVEDEVKHQQNFLVPLDILTNLNEKIKTQISENTDLDLHHEMSKILSEHEDPSVQMVSSRRHKKEYSTHEEWYPDGQEKSYEERNSGRIDRDSIKKWYPDGQIEHETIDDRNDEHDNPNHTKTRYDFLEDGTLKHKSLFHEKVGATRIYADYDFYEDGNPKLEEHYSFEFNSEWHTNDYPVGIWKKWDESGEMSFETHDTYKKFKGKGEDALEKAIEQIEQREAADKAKYSNDDHSL